SRDRLPCDWEDVKRASRANVLDGYATGAGRGQNPHPVPTQTQCSGQRFVGQHRKVADELALRDVPDMETAVGEAAGQHERSVRTEPRSEAEVAEPLERPNGFPRARPEANPSGFVGGEDVVAVGAEARVEDGAAVDMQDVQKPARRCGPDARR